MAEIVTLDFIKILRYMSTVIETIVNGIELCKLDKQIITHEPKTGYVSFVLEY